MGCLPIALGYGRRAGLPLTALSQPQALAGVNMDHHRMVGVFDQTEGLDQVLDPVALLHVVVVQSKRPEGIV